MSKKFSSEYQPKVKGRLAGMPDKKTMILEAIKQAALLNLPQDADKADIERAFFARIAKIALDDEHKDSGLCKQALLDRGWAKAKPEATMTFFDFDREDTPSEQAKAILEATSQGLISVEDAGKLISMIKDSIAIEEATVLAERLAKIEEMLKQ